MNSIRVASLNANISRKVPLITKIFVWSILLEPLIFFHIVPQNISGVGGSLSRILQFILLSILLLRFLLLGHKVRIFNPFSLLYANYTFFLIISIIAGILGYFNGSYGLNLTPEFLNTAKIGVDSNFVANLVHSPYFRPLFEYFIALYYFLYFVVLAQYILKTEEALNYFFKIFNFVFVTCLFIGLADLLLIISYEAYIGIPRYVADVYTGSWHEGTRVKGLRFHGIIGEPRDAFNFLILCIGLLTLKDIFYQERKLTFIWIALIFIACFLTFSFSGILGVIFSIGLLLFFFVGSLSLNRQFLIYLASLVILLLVIINIKYSPRMMLYYVALQNVFQSLNTGGDLSPVIANVMNNIYPVWHLWLEVKEYNFLHLIMGNGFGSASIVNNFYLKEYAIINPNASIIRMVYENGLIGIFLFIFAFISPLKTLYVDKKIYNKIKVLMLVMLGMYFAHRSVGLYIFFGITLVVLRYKIMEIKSNSNML